MKNHVVAFGSPNMHNLKVIKNSSTKLKTKGNKKKIPYGYHTGFAWTLPSNLKMQILVYPSTHCYIARSVLCVENH